MLSICYECAINNDRHSITAAWICYGCSIGVSKCYDPLPHAFNVICISYQWAISVITNELCMCHHCSYALALIINMLSTCCRNAIYMLHPPATCYERAIHALLSINMLFACYLWNNNNNSSKCYRCAIHMPWLCYNPGNLLSMCYQYSICMLSILLWLCYQYAIDMISMIYRCTINMLCPSGYILSMCYCYHASAAYSKYEIDIISILYPSMRTNSRNICYACDTNMPSM